MHAEAHHLNPYDDFIKSHAAKIKSLTLLVLREGNCTDADDHAQEVFNDIYIKVQQSWHTLRSPEDAINSITKNTASTHARRCRREVPAEPEDDASPLFATQALDPVALLEQAILLEEFCSKLKDPLDRAIFNLKFQGYTYEQMAVILDINTGTIRSRYSRAVEYLKLISSSPATTHT